MPAQVIELPLRKPPSQPLEDFQSFDTEALASEAMELLEAYQRAPWTQINDEVRLKKLEDAMALLDRIWSLERGIIALPVFGD